MLRCFKRNELPRAGGYEEQDWDFVLYTDLLDSFVTEHQALLAKTQQNT